MDLLWRIIYIIIISAFVWFLYVGIGHYPIPLPKSEKPYRETQQVLILWGVAVVLPALRIFVVSPWLNTIVTDRTLQELFYFPLLTIFYLIIPLFVVLHLNRWNYKDLGLNWHIQSPFVAIIAVLFGLVSGIVAYITNQAVIGIQPLPMGALILLLYNNDFLEEFFHRGVIQSKLERIVGQKKAILFGGILFGMTHVVFDITQLMGTQGILFVLFAFILQILSGWLLGIVYMKTRSLWPGVACHYLANWLPSILNGIIG